MNGSPRADGQKQNKLWAWSLTHILPRQGLVQSMKKKGAATFDTLANRKVRRQNSGSDVVFLRRHLLRSYLWIFVGRRYGSNISTCK